MVVQQKVWWTSEKCWCGPSVWSKSPNFFMNSGTWTGPVVPYPVSGSKMSITVHDQRGFLSKEEDGLNIPLVSGSSIPQGPSPGILPLRGYPVFWHKPWLQKEVLPILEVLPGDSTDRDLFVQWSPASLPQAEELLILSKRIRFPGSKHINPSGWSDFPRQCFPKWNPMMESKNLLFEEPLGPSRVPGSILLK